jgi:hypothetical protein
LALIAGAASVYAYKPAPKPLTLEEKVNAAEYIVVARVVRFRYFRFDNPPPAGQLEHGTYLGESVAELKPGMGKYEDIEVLRVLYPRGWAPSNPIPGNLGISWYPDDPVRSFHASTPRIWFLRAARAGKVAEGYLRPDAPVFRGVSIRGLAVETEPVEKLPEIEELVKRRVGADAPGSPASR